MPGRPWFRHTLLAPGLTTGYAPWTLPGLRQAVQEGDATMMAEQARILSERIAAAANELAQAAKLANTMPVKP